MLTIDEWLLCVATMSIKMMEGEPHARTYTVTINRLEWPGYYISGVMSINFFCSSKLKLRDRRGVMDERTEERD
jgi:hypothetical protein